MVFAEPEFQSCLGKYDIGLIFLQSIEPLAKVWINRICHSEHSEESLVFQ